MTLSEWYETHAANKRGYQMNEPDRDIVDRLREFNVIDIHDIMDGAIMEIVQLSKAVESIKEGAAIRIADLEKTIAELKWRVHKPQR